MFASLSLANPNHAHFYVIDLKEEGLEFSEYKKLKQIEDMYISVNKFAN